MRICNSHSIPLLAQSGGHGWGLPNTLQSTGVLINLRGLNRVSFSDDRTRAIVQGGTLVKELIDAAWEHDVHVVTGLCNTVGVLGAALGGGYGAMIGLHGLGVDNFLAMNVVLADGSAVEVTPEKEPDLWWAMRGAGSSFAIVVSCVVKAYPVPREENKAWSGALTFSGDKLEEIVKVMQELELPDNALNFFYLVTSGPPDFTPCVMVTPWYYGTSEEEARKFFKPIFDIGPLAEQVAMIPYPEWNSPSDPFCVKGGRKPGYGIVSSKMEPKVWREIWNNFVEFVQNPGTGGSVVLVEGYPHRKINSFPVESSSFPWRKGRFNCITIPIYHDPTLDEKAEEFGRTVRETLRKVEGSDLKVYVFLILTWIYSLMRIGT